MGLIELATGLQGTPNADGTTGQGGRTRETWTNADRRLLDRCAKMIRSKGDLFLLRCGNDLCPQRAITLEAEPSAERGAVLRCGCSDRVFTTF